MADIDSAALKTAIKNNLSGKGFDISKGKISDFVDAVCDEIISHLTTRTIFTSEEIKAGSVKLSDHTHSAGGVVTTNLTYVTAAGTPAPVTGITGGPS